MPKSVKPLIIFVYVAIDIPFTGSKVTSASLLMESLALHSSSFPEAFCNAQCHN